MRASAQGGVLSQRRLLLLVILLLALLPRLYSAQHLGRDWYFPGSFTLVNFDEGGSCRAALKGFSYSPFVGWQTIALSTGFGHAPPPGARDSAGVARAYCHSPGHLLVARSYSALSGALTAVLLVLLAWQLFPQRPQIGVLAGLMLALCGWHISESHSGTVDAPSVMFIYTSLLAFARALRKGGAQRWAVALLLLIPALWTKYWVFAALSLLALLPSSWAAALLQGFSARRMAVALLALVLLFAVVCNPALPADWRWALPPLLYGLLPWARMSPWGRGAALLLPWLAPLAMQVEIFAAFTAGSLDGRFGSDYGAIGWNKWLRNAVNLPAVMTVGLGLPGLLLALLGVRSLWREAAFERVQLSLLPLLAFALYMLALAPVTYYRHYLPLIPIACLFVSVGAYSLPRPWLLGLPLLLMWQALLAWDLVSDYHRDPRRRLPEWFAAEKPRFVLTSYYVNAPPVPGVTQRLFLPRLGAGSQPLQLADAYLLSENWYDTAFANELNGPRVSNPLRLIKTTPHAVRFYRSLLADEHPLMQVQAILRPPSFMPELLLHRAYYGSFTLFVGDLVILQPRRAAGSAR